MSHRLDYYEELANGPNDPALMLAHASELRATADMLIDAARDALCMASFAVTVTREDSTFTIVRNGVIVGKPERDHLFKYELMLSMKADTTAAIVYADWFCWIEDPDPDPSFLEAVMASVALIEGYESDGEATIKEGQS